MAQGSLQSWILNGMSCEFSPAMFSAWGSKVQRKWTFGVTQSMLKKRRVAAVTTTNWVT